jgi:hypothetical protein
VEPLSCPPETEASAGACRRTGGAPLCEPGQIFKDDRCVADPAQPTRVGGVPLGSAAAAAEPPVSDTVTRARSPQHDSDCQRHYSKTPVAYLFTGGKNFPARQPVIKAAGCVLRDVGSTWASACCPG